MMRRAIPSFISFPRLCDAPRLGSALLRDTVVIGRKADLQTECSFGPIDQTWLSHSLGLKPWANDPCAGISAGILSAACSRLSPGLDVGASCECFVPVEVDGTVGHRRVVLCALPSAPPSRHNCPALPHAITAFVKQHKKSSARHGTAENGLLVCLAVTDASHCLASALAVSRAFSLYSSKTSALPGMI